MSDMGYVLTSGGGLLFDRVLPSGAFTGCHAHQDGDCTWTECPQLRDGEPAKTSRHCPLDVEREEV